MTGGDIAKTADLLGNDPAVNAALTPTLSSQKRYGDALQTWSAIPLDLRQDKYRQTGQDLMNLLLTEQQYQGGRQRCRRSGDGRRSKAGHRAGDERGL